MQDLSRKRWLNVDKYDTFTFLAMFKNTVRKQYKGNEGLHFKYVYTFFGHCTPCAVLSAHGGLSSAQLSSAPWPLYYPHTHRFLYTTTTTARVASSRLFLSAVPLPNSYQFFPTAPCRSPAVGIPVRIRRRLPNPSTLSLHRRRPSPFLVSSLLPLSLLALGSCLELVPAPRLHSSSRQFWPPSLRRCKRSRRVKVSTVNQPRIRAALYFFLVTLPDCVR